MVILPIQHSRLAQGLVLTTSGGSTPILRHSARATLQVFNWSEEIEHQNGIGPETTMERERKAGK